MASEMDFNVADNEKVARMLQTIAEKKIPLTLEFIQADIEAASLLVAVDRDAGTIALDCIVDPAVHARAVAGELFNLVTVVDGVKVIARRLSVESVLREGDYDAYSVGIPSTLMYRQRRDVFRAQVDEYIKVPASVYAANTFDPEQSNTPLAEGFLSTVSVAGYSVLVNAQDADKVISHEFLTVLEIELPEQGDFPYLFAELRNNRSHKNSSLVTLGFQFTGNTMESKKQLGHLATRIQLLARRGRADPDS